MRRSDKLPHRRLTPRGSSWGGARVAFVGPFFSSSPSASRAPAGVIAAAVALTLLQDMAYFFADSPQAVVRKSYGSHPFEEAKKIALYLRANSEPDDRIVVLGSEPQIYFYADRRAATGFLYTYPLMEPQPYAVQTQEDMIAQIEQEDPRFLVVVEVPHSWLPRKSSSHLIFDWAN